MGKFKELLESLNINEKFNKRIHKQKEYNHVKDNIPLGGEGSLYRYYLSGLPNVSYSENELTKA